MSADRRGVSQVELDVRNLSTVPSRPSSSSVELREPHLWTSSPSPLFPETPKQSFFTQCQQGLTLENCLGCSTWPRTLAFVLSLILIIALCTVLPIVLINQFATTPRTTSTTATGTSLTTGTTTTSTTSNTISTTTMTTITSTTTTSVTTTTTSACGVGCAQEPISTTSRLAYYSFDGNTNDATGSYPASSSTVLTYGTGYVRSAVYLDASLAQRLTTSPMNLANRSFTVELWIYLTDVATQDNAFFGQQSYSNVGKQCLFLMCTRGKLYMGFFNDDTMGSKTLERNKWYHVAFAYDNDKRQRLIYLNGELDGQSVQGVRPYLGTTGPMTIGNVHADGNVGSAYFTGYIDELIIWSQVRTPCEILHDATLAVHATFDGTMTDKGPNSLALTATGWSYTTGYQNQAVYLSGSGSYVQVAGLTGLGQSNSSYSIAFWVYPIVKGVLVHISANSSGITWCTPFLTFTPAGNLLAQVYYSSYTNTVTGPSLIYNIWTHVTHTYSPINGQRLYINGALYTSAAGSTIYTASGMPNYLTLGSVLSGGSCYSPSTVMNSLQGSFDDLRVYSRELSSIDACLLAQS